VNIQGSLLRCSREQVREATSEEHLGVEMVNQLMTSMLEKLDRRGRKGFIDIEAEGPPPLEAEALLPAETVNAQAATAVAGERLSEAVGPPSVVVRSASASVGQPESELPADEVSEVAVDHRARREREEGELNQEAEGARARRPRFEEPNVVSASSPAAEAEEETPESEVAESIRRADQMDDYRPAR